MGSPKHDNDLRQKGGGLKEETAEARRRIAQSEVELARLEAALPRVQYEVSFLLPEVVMNRRYRREGLLNEQQKRALEASEKRLAELKEKIDEVEAIKMYIRSLRQAIDQQFF